MNNFIQKNGGFVVFASTFAFLRGGFRNERDGMKRGGDPFLKFKRT